MSKYCRIDHRSWMNKAGKTPVYTKQSSDMLRLRMLQQNMIPEGRVVGVYFDKQRRIWRANWREHEQGKRKTKNFSVEDYGFEEARRMAIQYRLAKLMEASTKAAVEQSQSASGSAASLEGIDVLSDTTSVAMSYSDKRCVGRARRRKRFNSNEELPSIKSYNSWKSASGYNLPYGADPATYISKGGPPGFYSMPYMGWPYDIGNRFSSMTNNEFNDANYSALGENWESKEGSQPFNGLLKEGNAVKESE